MIIKQLLKIIILTCCIFVVFANNSKAQNVDSCKVHFKRSRLAQSTYYKTNNPDALKKALAEVEQAMECPLTRKAAVTQKIGLLFLLKEYKTGYTFINTLDEAAFWHPYEKDMEYNYFRGMEYETKGDIRNRDKYLIKAKEAIQKYIDKESATSNKLDAAAYSGLLFIMKAMGDKNGMELEINTLKKNYPNDAIYIEGLEDSFINNNVHTAYPQQRTTSKTPSDPAK